MTRTLCFTFSFKYEKFLTFAFTLRNDKIQLKLVKDNFTKYTFSFIMKTDCNVNRKVSVFPQSSPESIIFILKGRIN